MNTKSVQDRILGLFFARDLEGSEEDQKVWAVQFAGDVMHLYSPLFVGRLSDEQLWEVYCLWAESSPSDFNNRAARIENLIAAYLDSGYLRQAPAKPEPLLKYTVGKPKKSSKVVQLFGA